MTTIRTTCEFCGDVELRPSQLRLQIDMHSIAGLYEFDCPACGACCVHPADKRIARVLIAAGVALEWAGRLAAEAAAEAETFEARPAGPTFTLDDLLSFHELLETDEWFERLSTAGW